MTLLRGSPTVSDKGTTPSKLLKGLHDKAYAQLGTSGSGNHFVDVGALSVVSEQETAALGLAPGRYLAVMSHSGSRGVGATIADHYARLAQRLSRLPQAFKHLAWLSLNSEPGQAYWTAMNLAGRFASANHHTLHAALAARLGIAPLQQLENHHNFAWLEQWQGREVVVHRKGATPAHQGVFGIVPGSQGHTSFVVQGKGNDASLNSASHGAGRLMSRTEAKKTISPKARSAWLAARGVELMGGGLDEAPQAYKNIDEVLALQSDLVEVVASFEPKLVLMSTDKRAED